MSFSKAKIQRFNDVKEATPSPADYNPLLKEKTKGAIIPQGGRFPELTQSPVLSDTSSNKSQPIFRTPSAFPKKKKIGPSSIKPTNIFPKSDLEELKEKIVECSNKDAYIQELTEQIEELKNRFSQLELQKAHLEEDKEKAEEESKLLKEEHNSALKGLHTKYKKELQLILEKAMDIKNQLATVKKEQETITKENQEDLESILLYLNKLQSLYQILQNEYSTQVQDLKQQHCKDLLKIKKEVHNQLKEFEEILAVTNSQIIDILEKFNQRFNLQINELKASHIEEKTKIIEENNAKIELLEENFKEVNLLNEMQMAEKLKQVEFDCQEKLEAQKREAEAILAECQKISECAIIETELEKNQLKCQLQEEQQKAVQLERQLDEALKQCNNYIHSEENKTTIEKLLSEKRAYEITISTFQDTIEVLKKRLFNSDRDVEQLKEELRVNEEKLLALEGKCNELNDEIEILRRVNDEKELEIESTVIIAHNKVKTVEKNLLNMVDKEIEKVNEKLINKDLLMEEIHSRQKLNDEAQKLIEKLCKEMENIESCYKDCEKHNFELEQEKQKLLVQLEANTNKILNLEKANEEKDELIKNYQNKIKKLEEEVEEVSEFRKKYIERSGKYDELLQKYEMLEKENQENKKTIAEQNSLIGPFKEQLEAYELERNSLVKEKNLLQNEAALISTKYADILGHQNQKQKIKHIQDLKSKILDLTETKMTLEKKLKYQSKVIEKLKREAENIDKKVKKVGSDNKENVPTPNSSFNDSTYSPIPLRNRNN